MSRSTLTPRPVLAVLATAALAVVLTACSGSSDGDATPAATAAPTADEAESTAADEPTVAEESTSAEAPAAAGDVASCMLGDWEMDTAAMKEQVEQMLGGAAADMSVDGWSRMTIDATTVASEVDTTATFATESDGTAMTGESVTKGSNAFSYTLAGDVLTYGELISADGTVSSTVTVGTAAPQTTEMSFADVGALSAGTSLTVACADDTLTFTTDAAGTSLVQTFTRR
ncbi:hypothetical protein [Miniimonas arenae]|uniref:hypothetical protein n=1 Tax=Miniimonas arenae TaxID=676201 RepID=UPI0028AD7C58|nr:hypothetical protein [Miniimonas arenae]